jgi:hypothetical protein
MFDFLWFYIKDEPGTDKKHEMGSEEFVTEGESKFLWQKLNATIINSFFVADNYFIVK